MESLATPRKKLVKPFFARSVPVADGVRVATPAAFRIGPALFISAENVGPTTPTMVGSSAICWAMAAALAGSEARSNSFNSTWHPLFDALWASIDTRDPSRTFCASAAFGPVKYPTTAIACPEQLAVPSPAGFAGSMGAAPPSTTLPVESSSAASPIVSVPGWPGLTVGLDSAVGASSVGAALDVDSSGPDCDVHPASRTTPTAAVTTHLCQVCARKKGLRAMYSPNWPPRDRLRSVKLSPFGHHRAVIGNGRHQIATLD